MGNRITISIYIQRHKKPYIGNEIQEVQMGKTKGQNFSKQGSTA